MANQLQMGVSRSMSIGGELFRKESRDTGDQIDLSKLEVPAAQPATLTTRTDNNTGTLTMTNSGHGITTGQIVDIYWTDPTTGLVKVMYQVTVGTVAGASVPIDLGVGDNLPLAGTSVVVGITRMQPVSFNSDNSVAWALQNGGAEDGVIVATLSDNTVQLFRHLAAGGADMWDTGESVTQPMGSNKAIAKIFFSHMDTAKTAVMKFGTLIDLAAN